MRAASTANNAARAAEAEGHDAKPKLVLLTYDPDKAHATDLLAAVKAQGVAAEPIGL